MGNQPEVNSYDVGVYQLELTDPVQGGVGGVSNTPLLNLANRTNYLKTRLDALFAGNAIPTWAAQLNSPTFTGSPTAPTPAVGDDSTALATTDFVFQGVKKVTTVNLPASGTLNLAANQYGYAIILMAGALTGNVNVVVPNTGRWIFANRTTGAFSVTVKTGAGTGARLAGQAEGTLRGWHERRCVPNRMG